MRFLPWSWNRGGRKEGREKKKGRGRKREEKKRNLNHSKSLRDTCCARAPGHTRTQGRGRLCPRGASSSLGETDTGIMVGCKSCKGDIVSEASSHVLGATNTSLPQAASWSLSLPSGAARHPAKLSGVTHLSRTPSLAPSPAPALTCPASRRPAHSMAPQDPNGVQMLCPKHCLVFSFLKILFI